MNRQIKMESVLELPHGKKNGRNSEGAFIKLKNGSLMFAYTRFVTEGDFGDGHIACRNSKDGGRSWDNKDRIIVENDALTTMSVSLLRLNEGRIALFYCRKTDLVNCTPHVRFSDDEGDTWSHATPLITAPGYYVMNNDRVIRYHDGRIIVPLGCHRAISDTKISHRSITIVLFSDDNGETWKESDNWVLPPQFSISGFQEPGIVQLMDRRIMGWARTDTGYQWVFFSHDRGETWSEAKPAPEFLSPESPMLIKRNPFDNHALYAIWNDLYPRYNLPDSKPSSWRRTPFVMARSRNEGKTWESHTVIENDPWHGFCYPALYFLSDAILAAYCCGTSNGTQGEGVLNDSRIIRIDKSTL